MSEDIARPSWRWSDPRGSRAVARCPHPVAARGSSLLPSCPFGVATWTSGCFRDGAHRGVSVKTDALTLLVFSSPSGSSVAGLPFSRTAPVVEFVRVNRPASDIAAVGAVPDSRVPPRVSDGREPPDHRFRPRGFSPPRRLSLTAGSGLVTSRYRTGFAAFPVTPDPMSEDLWSMRAFPGSAFTPFEELLLTGSRAASLRPLPPRRSRRLRAARGSCDLRGTRTRRSAVDRSNPKIRRVPLPDDGSAALRRAPRPIVDRQSSGRLPPAGGSASPIAHRIASASTHRRICSTMALEPHGPAGARAPGVLRAFVPADDLDGPSARVPDTSESMVLLAVRTSLGCPNERRDDGRGCVWSRTTASCRRPGVCRTSRTAMNRRIDSPGMRPNPCTAPGHSRRRAPRPMLPDPGLRGLPRRSIVRPMVARFPPPKRWGVPRVGSANEVDPAR
jgi:hypothetical protein